MGEAFNIFNLFLQVSDVVNPTTNLPFGNHSYHPVMVILAVVYSWLYHITFKPSYWNLEPQNNLVSAVAVDPRNKGGPLAAWKSSNFEVAKPYSHSHISNIVGSDWILKNLVAFNRCYIRMECHS